MEIYFYVVQSEHLGYTNETPANSYTSPRSLASSPFGKRIDYIVYKPGKFVKVTMMTWRKGREEVEHVLKFRGL